MKQIWSSNYCTLHVYICVVPARKASSSTSQMATEIETGINLLGPERPRPGTSQAPGNSNTLVQTGSKKDQNVQRLTFLCVSRCSKGRRVGKKKKTNSKLVRFNKNPHFHCRRGCSLLGCILWHQAPLRTRSWERSRKWSSFPGREQTNPDTQTLYLVKASSCRFSTKLSAVRYTRFCEAAI